MNGLMLVAATPIEHGARLGMQAFGFAREHQHSLAIASSVGSVPAEHHLSEPVIVPLPPRPVLDSTDW